jgi:hypothetical protein
MKVLLVIAGTVATMVAASDVFLPPLQVLDETNIQINFSYNLTCAACIRGGYFYCDPKNQTAGDEKCCQSLFDPSCLQDFSILKCMDKLWKEDSFNSLFNFCGSYQAKATCGN